jgi:hypothetical protein
MSPSTPFAVARDDMSTVSHPAYPWYGDVIDAYLELRERGIADIDRAVEALAGGGQVTPVAFDIIADGLFIYRVELEDEDAPGRAEAA